MASALSADCIRLERNIEAKRSAKYAITTAATPHVGGLANYVLASGRVKAATDASTTGTEVCVGVFGEVGGTGNTAGSVYARVDYGHEALYVFSTSPLNDVNSDCYVSNDNQVTSKTIATYDVAVGEVASIENLTDRKVWVRIRTRCGRTV